MLTPEDLERERYEARRKAQLDHSTEVKYLKSARLEGWLEGYAKGWAESYVEGWVGGRAEWGKIGMIHACEQLLNRSQTPTEQLVGLSLADLARLADDLQAQALKPH